MNSRDYEARLEEEIAGPLRAARTTIDELGRARLASAIEAALDRQEVAVERPAGTWRWRTWIASAGAAVVVAIVAGALLVRAFRAPPPVPAVAAMALLVPYPGKGAPPSMLAPSTSLHVLPGERARATIAGRVKLTLVGPGRLSVIPPARAGDVELALEGGRLMVDYDGHSGGTLRIRSPGSLTTVVGTLFAIEVTGTSSRVAVARGNVRTEDASGHVWQVAAGDSWTSADGRIVATLDELATALAAHERDWTSADPTPEPADPPGPDAIAASPPVHRRASPSRSRSPIDMEALYDQAEAAMRAHSTAAARRALETVASHDGGPLREQALLDLARLALADGDRAEARLLLGRLPHRLADPTLAGIAAHLRGRAAPGERDNAGTDPLSGPQN